MRSSLTTSALATVALFLAGCGGVSVYPVDSIPTDGIDGIPFRLQKVQYRVTSYYDKNKKLLYQVTDRVLTPDMTQLYVVEGKRNYGNPFEILKSTAVLNADGTLKSFAFESDPQLDEAIKATSEAAAGLVAMTSVADLPAHVSGNAVYVDVTFHDTKPATAFTTNVSSKAP